MCLTLAAPRYNEPQTTRYPVLFFPHFLSLGSFACFADSCVCGPWCTVQPELVQRLEEHTDRVYGVDFHPTDAILATASADFSIRIFTAKSKK